jgi:hypothetical protein
VRFLRNLAIICPVAAQRSIKLAKWLALDLPSAGAD